MQSAMVWEQTELRKTLPANEQAPRSAREAVPKSVIDFFVKVGRTCVRVEVSDGSAQEARRRTPDDHGGYGLTVVDGMASRWGAARKRDLNMTWFELDLLQPGA